MSDIKKPTQNVSGVGAINPLYHINQPSTNTAPVGGDSSGKQSTNQSALERQIRWILEFITANYTPNSEVMKLRLENAAKLANLDQKITRLEADVAERERVARINVYKNILKSYPKKNRTMNDLSKLTRADIDRRIAELTKDKL